LSQSREKELFELLIREHATSLRVVLRAAFTIPPASTSYSRRRSFVPGMRCRASTVSGTSANG
jgi:hypothetical protein